MEFREHTLPNGLQIVAECNPRAYSMSLGFFVNTGSRDETPELAGVSHFLEHMVFKGTPRRSAEDVNRELDELGSQSNAFTSEEHTVYYASVLPEYQHATLDLLADIMRPSLREEDFETEKQVILEEILKYDDQPPFGAHEKCMAAYFQDHPLGNSVLGTTSSVSALTAEAMREYFTRRYSPTNITLVASGRVDFDALIQQAQEACGLWPRVETKRDVRNAQGHCGMHVIHKEIATQQYAIQITAGPAAADIDRHAARLLCAIVGDDSGSRLYWELVDTGLAEFAGIAPYEFQGAGILMGFLCCAPEQTRENLERMSNVQQMVQTSGVTEDELELAKSKICSHLVRQSERPGNRLFSIGNGWLQRGTYQTIQERLAAYQRVTLADVRQVLENYPITSHATVIVGPENEP
ncbi:MAG: insulinase family protein [Planctomycetales bacterium]|nr:insulinase family protein [Planctomycetales bacterium]